MLEQHMNMPSPLEEAGWAAGYAAIARELAFEADGEMRPRAPGRDGQRHCKGESPRVRSSMISWG